MNTPEYFRNLYDYHYWGTHLYLQVASQLTDEQLHQSQGHSWGSIYDTLLHMMSAEWMWLQRWRGSSPLAFPSKELYPDLAAIQNNWDALEKEMRAFAADQTPQSLDTIIEYHNTKGSLFRLPLWQMMAHVVNHGSHHRGELAAMFALMNVPHPEDELYIYFLKKSGLM